MKKTIVIIFSLLSINAFAQKKDTATTQKDSVLVYQATFQPHEIEKIIKDIQALDEKPSVIQGILQPLLDKFKPIKIKK